MDIGRALTAEGIRFVHWKSNGHLAEALSGRTDIDMYADPPQREAVRACLAEQDCLEMLSQPWARYPDVEDWLAMDEETGRFLHLHLHFALVTGLRRIKHLRLPWGDGAARQHRSRARSRLAHAHGGDGADDPHRAHVGQDAARQAQGHAASCPPTSAPNSTGCSAAPMPARLRQPGA